MCPDAASAARHCPPMLPSCVDAQMPLWGDMLPFPGGRNPGSIPRFLVPMQACLPVAELGSRPPAIKYFFIVFRFCRRHGQDTCLRRPKVLSEKNPNAYCRADEVSSLAERRLPARPLLNSDPECSGSHRDWKIT